LRSENWTVENIDLAPRFLVENTSQWRQNTKANRPPTHTEPRPKPTFETIGQFDPLFLDKKADSQKHQNVLAFVHFLKI